MTPAQTSTYTQPSDIQTAWLIARRQAIEAVRDRSTLIMTCFFLVLQTVLILFSLSSVLKGNLSAQEAAAAGTTMAFFLLFSGIMSSAPAIGIAAGVFAGDKERGCLSPLLVTPASNLALFAGKVLGAILPAFLYSLLGLIAYFAEISLLFGPQKLQLLPIPLAILVILLLPGITLFGAAVASIISSRVSTFQSAQNYSSLITTVIWFGLLALIYVANSLGLWVFATGVAAIYIFTVLLLIGAATTWRREEVMAKQ